MDALETFGVMQHQNLEILSLAELVPTLIRPQRYGGQEKRKLAYLLDSGHQGLWPCTRCYRHNATRHPAVLQSNSFHAGFFISLSIFNLCIPNRRTSVVKTMLISILRRMNEWMNEWTNERMNEWTTVIVPLRVWNTRITNIIKNPKGRAGHLTQDLLISRKWILRQTMKRAYIKFLGVSRSY